MILNHPYRYGFGDFGVNVICIDDSSLFADSV